MDPLTVRLTGAYLLDWAIGDPRWLPHPVRGLGWAIQRGEGWLRGRIRSEEWAGGLLVIGIALGTWAVVAGLLHVSAVLSWWLAGLIEMALLFFCLSTRDLAVESWPVHHALRAGRLEEARRHLSRIVGRDTDSLEEPEVVRAAVETIGESTMDGIVAPLFYAAIGGAPLACLYKAVNTLDSMVGYRSARYLRFGKVAAAVDRAMNRVPAWLTAGALALAGGILFRSGLQSLRAAARDGLPTRENSFIAESAMAGALGVRLGGVNLYQGKPVATPWMGEAGRPLESGRIAEAIRLMVLASAVTAAAALGMRAILA